MSALHTPRCINNMAPLPHREGEYELGKNHLMVPTYYCAK